MNIEQLVDQKIESLLDTASKLYNKTFDKPQIKYTEKSTVAGRAYCVSNIVDFNKILLSENVDQFIDQTVTHELAHILAYKIYGTIGHDKYWKLIMVQLGAEPKRCHSYSIENVKKRATKTFVYKCACRDNIQISSIRHNKIVKNNQIYRCNACKTKIVPV